MNQKDKIQIKGIQHSAKRRSMLVSISEHIVGRMLDIEIYKIDLQSGK